MQHLVRKLGIKPGKKVLLLDAPTEVRARFQALPAGARLVNQSTTGIAARGTAPVDCVVAFVKCKADVHKAAPSALSAVSDQGLLWFAYPKKSGPLKSDLSRDSGWEPLFAAGFDTVAQISIDDTWTGFRFRPKHLVGK